MWMMSRRWMMSRWWRRRSCERLSCDARAILLFNGIYVTTGRPSFPLTMIICVWRPFLWCPPRWC